MELLSTSSEPRRYEEPRSTISLDIPDHWKSAPGDMNTPCNVLIYGGGAVGSIFGWRIAQHANTRVSVVCRSNFEAVKRSGFSFRTKVWGDGHFTPHQVYRSSNLIRSPPRQKFDYVVCANKVNNESRASIIDDLSRVVDADTTLVSAQNGMDVELPLSQAFPHNTILSAICNIGCSQPQHGQVTQMAGLSPKAFLIGTYAQRRDISNTRQKLLVSCDAKFGGIDDICKQRWRKLLFNSVWNATSALTNLDTHQALSRPDTLHLATSIAQEAYQVALEAGVDLGEEYPHAIINLARSSAAITPSTLQDARNRRNMEIDSIWGYLVSKAAQCRLSVPTIQMIYDLLQHMNVSFTQQQDLSVRQQLAQIFNTTTSTLPVMNSPSLSAINLWLDDKTIGDEELRRYTLNATAVG